MEKKGNSEHFGQIPDFFLCPQNVLELRVLHGGYADPNSLKFTEIKVLGKRPGGDGDAGRAGGPLPSRGGPRPPKPGKFWGFWGISSSGRVSKISEICGVKKRCGRSPNVGGLAKISFFLENEWELTSGKLIYVNVWIKNSCYDAM